MSSPPPPTATMRTAMSGTFAHAASRRPARGPICCAAPSRLRTAPGSRSHHRATLPIINSTEEADPGLADQNRSRPATGRGRHSSRRKDGRRQDRTDVDGFAAAGDDALLDGAEPCTAVKGPPGIVRARPPFWTQFAESLARGAGMGRLGVELEVREITVGELRLRPAAAIWDRGSPVSWVDDFAVQARAAG